MLQDSGSATAMQEIVIDRTATPDRRIMIADSFGQRIQMSVDQFRKLAAEESPTGSRRSRTFERRATPALSQRCHSGSSARRATLRTMSSSRTARVSAALSTVRMT